VYNSLLYYQVALLKTIIIYHFLQSLHYVVVRRSRIIFHLLFGLAHISYTHKKALFMQFLIVYNSLVYFQVSLVKNNHPSFFAYHCIMQLPEDTESLFVCLLATYSFSRDFQGCIIHLCIFKFHS